MEKGGKGSVLATMVYACFTLGTCSGLAAYEVTAFHGLQPAFRTKPSIRY